MSPGRWDPIAANADNCQLGPTSTNYVSDTNGSLSENGHVCTFPSSSIAAGFLEIQKQGWEFPEISGNLHRSGNFQEFGDLFLP